MVTIIGDSLGEYGVDAVGGRCHDLLGTRCDPYGGFSPSAVFVWEGYFVVALGFGRVDLFGLAREVAMEMGGK